MNDRSFMRLGGILGILIAVDALLAVVVYFTLVPAAQRLLPFAGVKHFSRRSRRRPDLPNLDISCMH